MVVNAHVPVKFHQAECSGSRVTVLTEKQKKTPTKIIQSVATARTVIKIMISADGTEGGILDGVRWGAFLDNKVALPLGK